MSIFIWNLYGGLFIYVIYFQDFDDESPHDGSQKTASSKNLKGNLLRGDVFVCYVTHAQN